MLRRNIEAAGAVAALSIASPLVLAQPLGYVLGQSNISNDGGGLGEVLLNGDDWGWAISLQRCG